MDWYFIDDNNRVARLVFDEDSAFAKPTVRLPFNSAALQGLSNSLVACAQPAKEDPAVQQHLDDLRTLVAKAYKVQFKRRK